MADARIKAIALWSRLVDIQTVYVSICHELCAAMQSAGLDIAVEVLAVDDAATRLQAMKQLLHYVEELPISAVRRDWYRFGALYAVLSRGHVVEAWPVAVYEKAVKA